MVILNMRHGSSLNLIHAIAHPNLPSPKPETYTAQTPATNACDFWRNPLVFHGISVQKIASIAIEKGEMLIASTSFCLELDLQNGKQTLRLLDSILQYAYLG